ncbi:SET6 [[Candida] subhashii]|uniref:SET6 n=1 Tax=[Candida] subhashii TaxID=561895 RepID=A0A8J5QS07_9ASCO|nr:SET6 [[Candida] subhashii]KAG7664237.1 SET6 [[Candida] subhashii]
MSDTEVPSEQSTLVESEDEHHEKIINVEEIFISPLFVIHETKYGGRGCFASGHIPKGTVVHRCDSPLSSTISKPFKKEVCQECFRYFDGKTLKVKLTKKFGKDACSLFFCTEECKDSFMDQDVNGVYLENLLQLEKCYLMGLSTPEIGPREPDPSQPLEVVAAQEWKNVAIWEQKLGTMKQSKRANMIPRLDEAEYLEIKYVIGVLFQMYKQDVTSTSSKSTIIDSLDTVNTNTELSLFNLLQSVEMEKVKKYPYLLYSYINIYKFLKLTCSSHLQKFINPDHVRAIIGKNLSNAFGIWSETSNPTEDKEFFGFGVYPSASFFNHSCAPNIVKTMDTNKLSFRTLRDILPGEELCINYGNYLDESVETRRKELSEWFFDCACNKCEADLEAK